MRSVNVEPRVERYVKASDDIRNSTKKLLIQFWADEGLFLSERQKRQFMECTPAESILRARRTLRATYPPDPEVEAEHYRRFQEELEDHSHRAVSIGKED